MTGLGKLTKRNLKMFFKDKGIFFTSLITPMILLILYATFLANVYRDSFESAIPDGLALKETLLNGTVGGQLFSSLLAVCCVTVAFCANMLMVQDKVTGSRKDMLIAPVKKSTLAISYYAATLVSTLIICLVATAVSLIYVANIGWYISVSDIVYILLDVFLLVMFGTALSSIINFFLTSQGQISAVGTIVSAGYGFICGAYMPISQFGSGLQKVISFLPCTYGTSLLKNHALRGVFEEMKNLGIPTEAIEEMKVVLDCNLFFNGNKVEISTMYLILGLTVAGLLAVYILMNVFLTKPKKK
ncbi:MAG: ABC transporter permease [Lachnospiraceae bacterium]|nr:ABC transporter permease [Lachnospiraceae bacterium]